MPIIGVHWRRFWAFHHVNTGWEPAVVAFIRLRLKFVTKKVILS